MAWRPQLSARPLPARLAGELDSARTARLVALFLNSPVRIFLTCHARWQGSVRLSPCSNLRISLTCHTRWQGSSVRPGPEGWLSRCRAKQSAHGTMRGMRSTRQIWFARLTLLAVVALLFVWPLIPLAIVLAWLIHMVGAATYYQVCQGRSLERALGFKHGK